ncbi:MAG TPA: RNA polymerase sigma factor, partial [Herpetosiphonaceae bacterium]|nr:RNA polymerase sigma factor [Herpetosiphonaceae bacterium]
MALSSSLNLSIARLDDGLDGATAGDVNLIVRSKAGDMQAFNLLIERYEKPVYAVCYRLLGDADAADATQETFLSAFRGIRGYRDGSFIAWLLRIARNECYDQLRARKRRSHVSLTGLATGTQAGDQGEVTREVP